MSVVEIGRQLLLTGDCASMRFCFVLPRDRVNKRYSDSSPIIELPLVSCFSTLTILTVLAPWTACNHLGFGATAKPTKERNIGDLFANHRLDSAYYQPALRVVTKGGTTYDPPTWDKVRAPALNWCTPCRWRRRLAQPVSNLGLIPSPSRCEAVNYCQQGNALIELDVAQLRA